MPGYVIGQIQEITDSDGFAAYQGAARPTLAKYGGKLVVNSTKVEALDGGWSPAAIVMIEFENIEQARKWYHSPEYQAAVGQRFDSSESSVIIVDGDIGFSNLQNL